MITFYHNRLEYIITNLITKVNILVYHEDDLVQIADVDVQISNFDVWEKQAIYADPNWAPVANFIKRWLKLQAFI